MMYLLSQNGLRLLESLCFTQTLFAFDFDGTLGPIVTNPDEAVMGKKTAELLAQLNKICPVAVISGRGLADLKKRLPHPPQFLVGNHGQEGLGNDKFSLNLANGACQSWKDQLQKFISKSPQELGITVEDKNFSLAIHYRQSRKKGLAKLFILEKLVLLDPPPRIIMGKSVVNLVPAGSPHKGIALLEILFKSNLKSAFYIGDDDTDEDIFALPDHRIFKVRVGPKKSSHAPYFIRRQSEINRLLSYLLRFHKNTQEDLQKSQTGLYGKKAKFK